MPSWLSFSALIHCSSALYIEACWSTSVGSESFSDLDFADDVALLAEMLSLLVLAFEIMDEEARPLGLTINWSKTKIQTMLDLRTTRLQLTASVEVVESFPYLG